jgi:UDP-N-acetylglucosamine 3-dehydrogenase
MNIGVLGTGFGAYHAQLLKRNEGVERIIVFGRNETKLEELKTNLGVEITLQVEDILHDPSIDIIHVCLPSHLHREYTVAALKNGKHVFCETPLCLSIEDVQAIKQAELEYGKKVLVNQFIKFDPAYVYLHDAIADQRYGKLRSLSLKRETPPVWGNLGLDIITTTFMIHELDFATWDSDAINLDHITIWGRENHTKEQALVHTSFESEDYITSVSVNSQLPMSHPFTVGYEAFFEQGKLVFHESSTQTTMEASLVEFTSAGTQKLTLETVDPYEKSIQHALAYFSQDQTTDIPAIIGLDEAIKSITLALDIQEKLLVGSKGE